MRPSDVVKAGALAAAVLTLDVLIAIAAVYAAFDGATVAFRDFFTTSVALTMGLKLVAALAGTLAAKRVSRPATVS